MVLGIAGLSAGINALTGTASNIISYNQNKKLMQYQNKLATQSRRNYYQDAKYSLLKAGYNPLLAIDGGAGASGMMGSIPSSQVDLGTQSALNGLATNWMNKDLVKAQTNLLDAQADSESVKQMLQTVQAYREQINTLLDQKNLDAFDKRLLKELKLKESEILKNTSATALDYANERYTNERSRGHNITNLDAYTSIFDGIMNNFTKKKWGERNVFKK